MSANFMGRELGYRAAGWPQASAATSERFSPLETFAGRLGPLASEVRAMGFDALDVWVGHLGWRWATLQHLALAVEVLDRQGLTVPSYAGGYGETADEFEAACRTAAGLGARILGGTAPFLERDRAAAVDLLERYDLRLGIENHDERGPEEMLELVGDGARGRIGTTLDTGWYATHGHDPARAVDVLGRHVVHVHLKDVVAVGSDETCRFGAGVVPIEEVVRRLRANGYRGAISVEHEPPDRDPTAEVVASLARLRGVLGRVA